jgi:hypothetical protein
MPPAKRAEPNSPPTQVGHMVELAEDVVDRTAPNTTDDASVA